MDAVIHSPHQAGVHVGIQSAVFRVVLPAGAVVPAAWGFGWVSDSLLLAGCPQVPTAQEVVEQHVGFVKHHPPTSHFAFAA